jgi:hypothetical protein
MKQSGQQWIIEGARNALNLRVTRKNLQWYKITELTKSESKAAAKKQKFIMHVQPYAI